MTYPTKPIDVSLSSFLNDCSFVLSSGIFISTLVVRSLMGED